MAWTGYRVPTVFLPRAERGGGKKSAPCRNVLEWQRRKGELPVSANESHRLAPLNCTSAFMAVLLAATAAAPAAAKGTITTFEAPNRNRTYAYAINGAGAIAGFAS